MQRIASGVSTDLLISTVSYPIAEEDLGCGQRVKHFQIS